MELRRHDRCTVGDVRHALAAAVAALAALILAATAEAALEVRLSVVPASPRVGQPAKVQAQLLWPHLREDGTCCRLEPARTAYPLRVEAVSPRGRSLRVRLHAVAGRDGLYRARFRFRVAGQWQLLAANWAPSYAHAPGARPRLYFRVRLR